MRTQQGTTIIRNRRQLRKTNEEPPIEEDGLWHWWHYGGQNQAENNISRGGERTTSPVSRQVENTRRRASGVTSQQSGATRQSQAETSQQAEATRRPQAETTSPSARSTSGRQTTTRSGRVSRPPDRYPGNRHWVSHWPSR